MRRVSHKTRTKSPEILDDFYKFPGCVKSFYHLVPSPVGGPQLYHKLGMGLHIGDKNRSKKLTNQQVILATLFWFYVNRSHICLA